MSYHSIHLQFPANPPFDQENWFETFVGQFVKPLLATGLVDQFWFTRYGTTQLREIRLRLTTNDFAALQPTIQGGIQQFHLTDVNDEPNPTIIGTFMGARVHSPDSPNPSADARGQLLLDLNHAIAALFVDCLVGPDGEGRFRQEQNADLNNPHGSIFETVHHLLCNTTDVFTEVEVFRLGNNMLGVEGPLYAGQMKGQAQAQNVPIQEWGKMRVRF
jgi:hypothetical protein